MTNIVTNLTRYQWISMNGGFVIQTWDYRMISAHKSTASDHIDSFNELHNVNKFVSMPNS